MVGALVTSLIVTPLEVVKVRIQSSVAPALTLPNARNALECTACNEFAFFNGLSDVRLPKPVAQDCCDHLPATTSTVGAIRWIVRCEGVGALFNGLGVTLWMSMPATVLYFASYEQLRDMLNREWHSRQENNALVAGMTARTIAATCVAPFELVRTRIQSRAHPPSILEIAREIRAEAGIRSFWKGLSPTLLRDVPFSGIYWYIVEGTRTSDKMNTYPDPMRSFVSGAFGGTIAAVLTHPFDVIKTRRQVFEYSECKGKEERLWGITRRISAEEGAAGFLRGMVPRVLKIAPSTAIMLGTYELGKLLFDRTE